VRCQEPLLAGTRGFPGLYLTAQDDIDIQFFPVDPLVCLTSLATKKELFFFQAGDGIEGVFQYGGIKILKTPS
jgi:hypothetical protein